MVGVGSVCEGVIGGRGRRGDGRGRETWRMKVIRGGLSVEAIQGYIGPIGGPIGGPLGGLIKGLIRARSGAR